MSVCYNSQIKQDSEERERGGAHDETGTGAAFKAEDYRYGNAS